MNLYRIINDIKSTCMSHRDVQDFHYGDIYDYENTKSLKYINTNFTLQNISSGLDSDTKTINGVLFCVDRLTDNGDNKLIVQSRCTDILESIINRLTENYSGWNLENTVYEVFSTKFADLCAGCFCTFSLSVDEDSVCSDDEFIVKSKEIKGNGIYDVIGYDRIIVDVQPKLKEIEIVKNGVYLPEEDSDGYNKITVNVPPTPTQDKSVNITENGTQRIVPDSGYNLSGVDVNVNVPPTPVQDKSVNIIENGTTSVLPDAGYNLNKVNVTVDVPPTPVQVKSVNITENGVKRIIPDSGYNLSGVDVNVNVPNPTLEELSVTENGVYTPTEYGYSKVTVDVPPTPVQEKSVNITENGTTSVVPDLGYNLSKVDITVDVHSTGSLKLTNGTKLGFSTFTVLPDYDFSDITDMDNMFSNCSSLTSVPLFDTSNVLYMSSMFSGCASLTTIPLLDTSNVRNMSSMFSGCSRLTSVPEMNTSNVTNMGFMFYGCGRLTSVQEMNTSKVLNMDNMFYNCSSLTSIPQLDTNKLTDMNNMFYNCSSLTSIPQIYTGRVRYISRMFYECNKITDLGGFVNLGKVFRGSQTLDLSYSPLTNQSVQNLIDTVFDMNQNTKGGSATLKLSQSVINSMTDTQKSQLAAKGWTLTN